MATRIIHVGQPTAAPGRRRTRLTQQRIRGLLDAAHVVAAGGKWLVIRMDGAGKAKRRFASKEDALRHARGMSKNTVYVHENIDILRYERMTHAKAQPEHSDICYR